MRGDTAGNITQITNGSGIIQYKYTYDDLGQLTREDNRPLGYSYTYSYDNAGNITAKKRYSFTLGTLGTANSTTNYTYGDNSWGDLLTQYGGMTITYDEIGNPITMGEWISFSWDGRQLKSYYDDEVDKSVIFTYNADGIRTSKELIEGDIGEQYLHEYVLNGTQIISETVYNKTTDEEEYNEIYMLVYIYDETGAPIGMKYRTPSYARHVYDCFFFEKNLQGDIVSVYNSNGSEVISYTYDAWGNITTTYPNGYSAASIARYNPFKYRSYYYDADLGLYYLQSRYYNPVWGRFINADNNFSNYNLFMYSGNNPVNRIDPDGEHWYYLWIDDLIEAIDELIASVSNIVYGRAAYERSYYDPKGANDLWNSRPFQDTEPSQEMQTFAGFMYDNDFVVDVSVSASIPKTNIYVKVGASKLFSPNKGLNVSYVHAGVGVSTPSIVPITVSYSVGKVNGVLKKEDYAKHFRTTGASALYGFDNSYWPKGSSSYSFTVSNSYGIYDGYDYYWCID